MPSSSAFQARLQFQIWRDEQMLAITRQLSAAFPALVARLSLLVEEADLAKILKLTTGFKSSVATVIDDWRQEQLLQAMRRGEGALERAIALIPRVDDDDRQERQKAAAQTSRMIRGGILAASLASIPAVLSFSVSTTSFLGFLATTAIAWPALLAGLAGISVVAALGLRSPQATAPLRRRICRSIVAEAERAVFGLGRKPGLPCILSDIQAAVLRAGESRFKDR